MEIRVCKECGFILGTRPNSKDVGGGMFSLSKQRQKEHN